MRGTPRLIARFEDVDQAREALVALRSAGTDTADVGLVGETPTPSDPWELTFREGAGRSAWVAVYGGDIDRARHLLAERGAAAFRRPTDLDALGRLFRGIDTGRRPA